MEKLIDLKMTKTELAEKAEVSRSTLAKMRKNDYVALEEIERICQALDCDIIDVASCLPNEESTEVKSC